MNLSESYKQRIKQLAGIQLLKESLDDNREIVIRSKEDNLFEYNVFYDRNNKIVKVENKGDMGDKLITHKSWLNLFLELSPGKILDFDFLRNLLSELPELYVSDIV